MAVHQAMAWHRRDASVLGDKLVTPEHPQFEHARQAWNLAVDQRPAAVVAAESPADVAAAVSLARQRGLRLSAQGTGHGAAALGSLDDTILVKTRRMRTIEIDSRTGIARLEAGVTWSEAVDAAASSGLALLAGSSPDVGVVGYTLGGGLSWLGRRYGLAANSVHAVELVTAEGEIVRADQDHEPELFWALRGGGGSFGIVTAIELRAVPVTDVYAGLLWWPMERGAEVLHCWRELTHQDLPDELTTVGRYLRLPPLPDVPEPLRGRSFTVVEVFHLGNPADADAWLEPLRALGPENDTLDVIPVETLGYVHMDPDRPVPFVGDGMLLGELPSSAVDRLEQLAGAATASPLLSVEVRHLGGELSRPAAGGGALTAVDAPYALFALGIAPTADAGRAVGDHVGHLINGLDRWSAGEMYVNFAESRRDPVTLWGEDTYRRLRQIKGRVDPDDLIRSNHPVTPA